MFAKETEIFQKRQYEEKKSNWHSPKKCIVYRQPLLLSFDIFWGKETCRETFVSRMNVVLIIPDLMLLLH